jgi:hypothetical protein
VAIDDIPVPSMFDPDLSMELSQHLFNIQFGMLFSETKWSLAYNSTVVKRVTCNNLHRPNLPRIVHRLVLGLRKYLNYRVLAMCQLR